MNDLYISFGADEVHPLGKGRTQLPIALPNPGLKLGAPAFDPVLSPAGSAGLGRGRLHIQDDGQIGEESPRGQFVGLADQT